MSRTVVRLVRPGELSAVAGLRWQWVLENGGTPTTSRDDFVRRFVAWAQENQSTHRCLVLVHDDVVSGMAWLALTPRVPYPGALERASGDLQCLYVVPGERDSGLGGQLVDAVLALARDLGLERVTVHSSDRAVSAYARAGFSHSPRLLQADVAGGR
jgi:GNAT superfamily N-acetyltransferase